MTEDISRWIWIPHWRADDEHPGFQHYKDRDPVWIKNYRSLLSDDHYLDLNLAQRGLVHGLWLVTAAVGNGRIPYKALPIRRHLGLDSMFRLRQLDPLIQEGFIDIRASEGLADRYQVASPEKKREEEKPLKVSPSSSVSSKGAPTTADAAVAPPNGKPQPPNAANWTEEAETKWRQDLAAWATKEGIL